LSLRHLIYRVVIPIVLTTTAIFAAIWFFAATGRQGIPAMLITAIVEGLLIVGLVAVWRWQNWSSPVKQIQIAAEKMAAGNWAMRIEPRGIEDVRQIANQLNLLASQAQTQLNELRNQRAGLQALVNTLPDPILAADDLGRIILLNTPAASLLQLTPAQALHQKLVHAVNDAQIISLYEAISHAHGDGQKPAGVINREIRLVRDTQRFVFQAVATQTPGGGALLVLRDVSRQSGAAQMKTDFVANASHELRTPIAALKIAFETLCEVYREDPVQSERCIQVIEGHIRRLEEMLRDLMDLSRVENAELKAQISSVKTEDVLTLIRSSLGAFARQKNIELVLDDYGPAAPAEFVSDSRLLHLVLKNLVENSIKFTPGGGRVTVTVRAVAPAADASPDDHLSVVFTVSDTGIGIAPEHIDRVFERFYQVDSARSGSAGRGTGLGLAIVKHAVHALGGTVKLDSKLGQGTTVTCEFPQ